MVFNLFYREPLYILLHTQNLHHLEKKKLSNLTEPATSLFRNAMKVCLTTDIMSLK